MSGLSLTQFKNLIIHPVLEKLSLGGASAVNLVTGTALAESGLTYLKQCHGPALGLFQMEPETHHDIWENFLQFRPLLAEKIYKIAGHPAPEQMMANLAYGCAMCRLQYLRAKDALPRFDDAQALAVYHKIHYNTPRGKADITRNIALFQEAIDG